MKITQRKRQIIDRLKAHGWSTAMSLGTTDVFMQKMIDDGLVIRKPAFVIRRSFDAEYGYTQVGVDMCR